MLPENGWETNNSHLNNIFFVDSRSIGLKKNMILTCTISNCMQFEVEVMKKVYKKLQDLGIDLSTCVSCFDGCMVLKSELEKIGYTKYTH